MRFTEHATEISAPARWDEEPPRVTPRPSRREPPGMDTPFALLRRLALAPPLAPPGWAALPLRAIVGFGFLQHGWAKLARGPDDFIGVLHAIGVPWPALAGWATISVEMIGGGLVLLGLAVPLAAIPMAAVLLVAVVSVHWPNGFSSIKLQSFSAATGAHFGQPGYKTDLLYLAGLAALVLGGSGPLALGARLPPARVGIRRHKAMMTTSADLKRKLSTFAEVAPFDVAVRRQRPLPVSAFAAKGPLRSRRTPSRTAARDLARGACVA